MLVRNWMHPDPMTVPGDMLVSEAKRLITEGGAKVNDEIVTDAALRFGASHLVEPLKLTAGKKRHALVVLA